MGLALPHFTVNLWFCFDSGPQPLLILIFYWKQRRSESNPKDVPSTVQTHMMVNQGFSGMWAHRILLIPGRLLRLPGYVSGWMSIEPWPPPQPNQLCLYLSHTLRSGRHCIQPEAKKCFNETPEIAKNHTYIYIAQLDFPGGTSGKEPSYQFRRHETWDRSLVGKISGRRVWQPTPVSLPGESQG